MGRDQAFGTRALKTCVTRMGNKTKKKCPCLKLVFFAPRRRNGSLGYPNLDRSSMKIRTCIHTMDSNGASSVVSALELLDQSPIFVKLTASEHANPSREGARTLPVRSLTNSKKNCLSKSFTVIIQKLACKAQSFVSPIHHTARTDWWSVQI